MSVPSVRPVVPIIDVGAVFRGVFADPDIVMKVLIGSLLWGAGLLLLPLVFTMPVLLGYFVMTTRNAIAGELHPLPEWTAFGTLWSTGARYVVVLLVYMLPAAVVGLAAFALMFGGAALGNDGGQVLAVAGVTAFYVLIFGASLLSVLLRFTLFPVIHIQLAETGEIGSCFAFREMFDTFVANPWNIMLSGLVEYAGQFAVSAALCMCILPAFPVSFLVYAISSSALGHTQRNKLVAYGEMPGPAFGVETLQPL